MCPEQYSRRNSEENDHDEDDAESDTDENSTTLPTSNQTITTETTSGSSSPINEGNQRRKHNTRATLHAVSTTSQMSKEMQTTEKIQSSSSPKIHDKENANRQDYIYTESSKISLTLAIALILVALCVGAVVTAVILCCTQEKWTSHFPSQRAHHASKSSTERSDAVIVMSDIHIPTGDSIYVDPIDNKNRSANNVPGNRGDEHLDQRVQSAPNEYEIVFERGHERSSFEHPYDCVSAGNDVIRIADNQMGHNETINKEDEHDYFVLSLNERDGKNVTEGSEMKMVDENHDYFVLAPHERNGENLAEGNTMAEKNHGYSFLP
ncbi:hypothetical protein CHS0354_040343 [Potamilus streckersoni]|uniref:Uncharacterized protein n=1 Tax=Potamilus streckersoni TaxID=2493646 RepID=A0AAE0VNN7_9BIVA|nr:hypothetical protein CHS0354_040343 [Potamilus streckersoni]